MKNNQIIYLLRKIEYIILICVWIIPFSNTVNSSAKDFGVYAVESAIPEVRYTYSYDGSKITVDCFDVEPYPTIILALYKDGKISDIELSSRNPSSVEFETDIDFDGIKIMVWDSEFITKPLVASKNVSDITDYDMWNNYAYVIDAVFVEENFTDAWFLKLLTNKGEIVEYVVRKMVQVNDEYQSASSKHDEFFQSFAAGTDGEEGTVRTNVDRLIIYSLDSKDRLATINTLNAAYFSNLKYDSTSKTLGNDVKLPSKTCVFNISCENSDDYTGGDISALASRYTYSGFYVKDYRNKSGCVVITEPSRRVETLNISDVCTVKKRISYSIISYYPSSSSSKTEEYKIDKKAEYIYNKSSIDGIDSMNKLIRNDKDEILTGEEIEFEFIEKTGDDKFDVVSITKYDYDVVKSVNKDADIIFGMKNDAEYDLGSENGILLTDKYGNEISSDNFLPGDVIAYVFTDDNNGKPTEIVNFGNQYVDGVIYETDILNGIIWIFSDEYIYTGEDIPFLGDKGRFYLTKSGKVFFFEKDTE